MTAKTVVIALALLLSATSASLAQGYHHHAGVYFGNGYGPGGTVMEGPQHGAGIESQR